MRNTTQKKGRLVFHTSPLHQEKMPRLAVNVVLKMLRSQFNIYCDRIQDTYSNHTIKGIGGNKCVHQGTPWYLISHVRTDWQIKKGCQFLAKCIMLSKILQYTRKLLVTLGVCSILPSGRCYPKPLVNKTFI